MAKNSVQDKSDHQFKEEEEEEEALSLCDLPVTLINNKVQQHQPRTDPSLQEDNNFDFNSHGGSSFSKASAEMCSADEVFFQGQILPLRLPSSSSKIDEGNNNIKQFIKFMPCESRSESMDHCSLSEFRSSNSSSRSSSLRSQNSSTSITSSTTTKTKSKPRIRNQFHTIPSSPKPQLRQSSTSLPRNSISSQGRKSSSAWEFFRVGVFPAPEIGLHDIKTRKSIGNRTSSVSGNNSSSHSTTATKRDAKRRNYTNHALKQFVGKGGGIFSGCSCSVDTVAQIDARKGGGGVGAGNNSNDNKNKGSKKQESETHAAKEKVLGELINEKKKTVENREKEQQVKKTMVMSRRRLRTFQWLKELHATSNDSILEERALLSSSSSN